MRLGELIAIARECKGWTLRDLEGKCGVSNALISQIENDKVKNPGFLTLLAIVEALGLRWERVIETCRPVTASMLRTSVIGNVSGEPREGDQVPGMPHAICHACGLGYRCTDIDCPNTKTDPNLVMKG